MQIKSIFFWIDIFFILLAANIAWLGIIFILHFFVPKAMLRSYFCEPYFSSTEVEFFTGFPYAYIRTAMFMRLAGWPCSGKKRGLTEAYKLAPLWFRRISRLLVSVLLVIFPLMMALLLCLAITLEMIDT